MRGFTLLELLIVIGILAILATTAVVVLNPAEFLKQTRDVRRMADLATLDKAFDLYNVSGGTYFGTSSIVYISLPDTSTTCNNVSSSLPALPTNWSYNCVAEANLRKIDGTGWIPVNFTNISITPPLSVLPIDPVNAVDSYSPSYYSYIVGSWKFATELESQKYKGKKNNSNNISYSLCPAIVKDTDYSITGIEYPNVLINGQCWTAKNINRYGYGYDDVLKLCYYGNNNNCDIYGGLYTWNDTMKYFMVEGNQGICPNNWHIPTDLEFKTLETTLGMPQEQVDNIGDRGDINLVSEFQSGGSSNFNWLLDSGYWDSSANSFLYGPHLWLSSEGGSNAWGRSTSMPVCVGYPPVCRSSIQRNVYNKNDAFSVRCLKND